MKSNFITSLDKVLKHEGGFVNHPKDPGGATMRGVTLYNYRRYVNPKATVSDLKNITRSELEFVYKKFYWDKCRCDDLPSGVDYAVFDFAVNSGPGRAARFLQRILGVAVDGKIGPITAAAAGRSNPETSVKELCDNRLSWLKTLQHWSTFGRGWTNRVKGVRKEAIRLADLTPPVSKVPQATPDTPSTMSLIGKIIMLVIKLLSRG